MTLADNQGGSDTDASSVTVNNLAPSLSNVAAAPSTITAGNSTTLSGNINDAGTLDTHSIVIDWGDGSPDTSLDLAAGITSFSIDHQYAAAGNFTNSVTASDDDGGMDTATTGVTVEPAPLPPSNAPSNLTAVGISTTEISLSWIDNSNDEDGFIIERCSKKNCRQVTEIGQVGSNVTSFLDSGLTANSQSTYRVRAFNAGGPSAYSNTATGRTLRR